MKKNTKVCKENIHNCSTKPYFWQVQHERQTLQKVKTIPNFKHILETKNDRNNLRNTAAPNIMRMTSFKELKGNYLDQMILTEPLFSKHFTPKRTEIPPRTLKKQKKERMTCKPSINKVDKNHHSVDSLKKKNKSTHEQQNCNKMEIDWNIVRKIRKSIQLEVKKKSIKSTIPKKDFLKISQSYEKLIDKISEGETRLAQKNLDFFMLGQTLADQPASKVSPIQLPDQSFTIVRRQSSQSQEKGQKKKMQLQLKGLKTLKIPDYHDEFMSHYDQLSDSWKRDINVQKRY